MSNWRGLPGWQGFELVAMIVSADTRSKRRFRR
jgi:hypothetical protein